MEVAAAQVCTSIDRLQPGDSGTRFPVDVGRLFCFSRISGIRQPTRIQHVWYLDGKERFRKVLPVAPPSWRTFSSKRIRPSDVGPWRIEISDAEGNVMQTLSFAVTAPPLP
jgi:hypothetical protein